MVVPHVREGGQGFETELITGRESSHGHLLPADDQMITQKEVRPGAFFCSPSWCIFTGLMTPFMLAKSQSS